VQSDFFICFLRSYRDICEGVCCVLVCLLCSVNVLLQMSEVNELELRIFTLRRLRYVRKFLSQTACLLLSNKAFVTESLSCLLHCHLEAQTVTLITPRDGEFQSELLHQLPFPRIFSSNECISITK
jgi:hypothetical protein